MGRIRTLGRRLLRIPLFYKILLANSAIVALGAIVGTVVTVWHVRSFPDNVHYELIALFALAGFAISFAVNNRVLKVALSPLDRLQDAVDKVRQGARDVRLATDPLGDERFDRLAATFNQMLTQLEDDAQQLHRLSRQILQAQEEERQRLARELHDEAAQALTSLLVRLRLLERAHDPEEAQRRVSELRELTAQALEEVRRVAVHLRPTILDDLGLGAALEWRVDELNAAGGLEATYQVIGLEKRLPRDIELVFYRVGQEALSNIGRHARATHASVLLQQIDGTITLEIRDDGAGFDPARSGASGLGLVGMKERMGMIGGELAIRAQPGQGTTISARAPLPAAKAGRATPGADHG
jgi:two-component system, NarL family, sensor histidine kinase UhpB